MSVLARPPRGGKLRAVIVDAAAGGPGNLERALRRVGSEVEMTADPGVVERARCLLLPGVGPFRPSRAALRGPLETALRAALASGAFLLGIDLGCQLLFEESDEGSLTDGLALLPGRVTRLPGTVRLPHVGWNRLWMERPALLLEGMVSGGYGYFIHSFAAEGVPEALRIAVCDHGRRFPAVVGGERLFGVQFHPEKSGTPGLRLLANFLEMAHGVLDGR